MILGIDPGAHTGVATFANGKLFALQTIHPHELPDQIRAGGIKRVIFEDSRLQSHVWTKAKGAAALKVARNVGEIDAWCKLIVAVCEQIGIPAHGISPKSKGEKLDAEQFERLTGWKLRSNQHERDAAAVAWIYRNSVI